MPSSAAAQRLSTSIRQGGPFSASPRCGQSLRCAHGVRMRPMNHRPASKAPGRSAASSCGRSGSASVSVIDPDHHVRGLDDRGSGLAHGQPQLLHRRIGDRGGDDGADISLTWLVTAPVTISTTVPRRTFRALVSSVSLRSGWDQAACARQAARNHPVGTPSSGCAVPPAKDRNARAIRRNADQHRQARVAAADGLDQPGPRPPACRTC